MPKIMNFIYVNDFFIIYVPRKIIKLQNNFYLEHKFSNNPYSLINKNDIQESNNNTFYLFNNSD